MNTSPDLDARMLIELSQAVARIEQKLDCHIAESKSEESRNFRVTTSRKTSFFAAAALVVSLGGLALAVHTSFAPRAQAASVR